MEQRTRHTYALPSSKSRSPSSESIALPLDNLAPPSPRGRGILLPPAQYGASHSQRTRSSSTESRDYNPSEWALIGIERENMQSKYTVTLMHWPTTTLYAWPLDPKSSRKESQCYITPTRNRSERTDLRIMRTSLRVLEDAVRTWMRCVRTKPNIKNGGVSVAYTELEQICNMLSLAPATQDQCSEWLQLQQLPNFPQSAPSSNASSPNLYPQSN